MKCTLRLPKNHPKRCVESSELKLKKKIFQWKHFVFKDEEKFNFGGPDSLAFLHADKSFE